MTSTTEHLIVVQPHGLYREYWPCYDGRLIAGDESYDIVRSDDQRHIRFHDDEPPALDDIASAITAAISTIPGIESATLYPKHITIGLRPGYDWSEVDPHVLAAVQSCLQWDSYLAVDYDEWRQANEAPQPGDGDEYKMFGSVAVSITAYSFKIAMYFMPPHEIVKKERRFPRSLGTKSLVRLAKTEVQAQEIVRRGLALDGVVHIVLSPFTILLVTTPAFDPVTIRDCFLDILNDVLHETPGAHSY